MDTTLVTVTLLSMAMAITLSVIVWRMLRDERQRSAARVMALTQMARPSTRQAASMDLPLRAAEHAGAPAAEYAEHAAKRPAEYAEHAAKRPAECLDYAGSIFAERRTGSPWGGRLVVMICLALAGAAVVLFALASQNRRGAVALQAQAARNAAPAAASTLELLSLRDTRQPGSLTISGVVQNPRAGAALSRVAVTAFAFDEKGAFLASGRALLDVTALAPGDESSFVVTVPVTDGVARYRIGFRTEDGRVVAHVDKRQPGPVALNW